MAKYFLTNYEKLPEETKQNGHFIRYINFGILLFIVLVFIKQGEQMLISPQDKIYNHMIAQTDFRSTLEVVEKKAVNIINKEKEILSELPEYANAKIKNLEKIFESEIQDSFKSKKDIIPTTSSQASSHINSNINSKNITINIKTAMDDDKISSLLLAIFEELQVLGEDQAYIDIGRNKLGVVTAIYIKGIKNLDSSGLEKLINKINQSTGVIVHKH